jgi:hypothetical protein
MYLLLMRVDPVVSPLSSNDANVVSICCVFNSGKHRKNQAIQKKVGQMLPIKHAKMARKGRSRRTVFDALSDLAHEALIDYSIALHCTAVLRRKVAR